MRIEYTCEDGSQTLAAGPSMALQHWLDTKGALAILVLLELERRIRF